MADNNDGNYSFCIPKEHVSIESIKETVDADIVVVGAGLAGLSASVRCAQLGLKTIVIEKTRSWSARGGHIGAANAKPWRDIGLYNDKKELVREWIGMCGNRAREEQVWLFANNSEDAINWLIDIVAKYDTKPVLNGAMYKGPTYTERVGSINWTSPDVVSGKIPMPAQVVGKNLYEESISLGVEYYFEMPGLYLEKNDDRITGIVAGKEDDIRLFNAKYGVFLATGDIHGDKEMLEAYAPMLLKVANSQYTPKGANTGDGHKMGLWVGGQMEEAPLPTVIHPQGYNRLQSFFLFVNTLGQRFMNEDTWCQAKSINVLKQPGNVDYAFAIFDSDWKQQLIDGMPFSGGMFNDNSGSVYGKPFTGEREQLFFDTGIKNGMIQKADTIRELATLIGVSEDNLQATVDRFNNHVENKDDPDYGKRPELLFPIVKPPYYASKFGPAILAVMGGLLVDTHLRVEDENQNAIKGLYAIGNVAGGLYGVDYPTIIPGNGHGRAVTWGYLAAQFAIDDYGNQE